MVELQATTAHGTVALVGVAVAEGGVVATTADLLRGVQRVVMIGPDGKPEPASVVATDAASDVALVNVPEDLPVAPFADDAALDSGAPDLTLSYVPAGGTRDRAALHARLGDRRRGAIAEGPAGGMPSITSSAPAPTVSGGQPLLNASGDVVGILYDPDPGTTSAVTFLPSELVVGVADDLRSRDRVVHGMAGHRGHRRARTARGAKVETVAAARPRGQPAGRRATSSWRSTPCRCAPWPSCGPASTCSRRARRLTLSVQRSSGATKAVGVTLGASS